MENWIKSDSKDAMVLSSRIRFARNLKGRAFPYRLGDDESKNIIKDVETAFYSKDRPDYTTVLLWEQDRLKRNAFLERHVISHKLLSSSKNSAFIVNNNETSSIMINEEDHLRIQTITAGFSLKDAYNCSNLIDDELESGLDYAFHEKLGYLTACPTNVGTGMRASVMIHLPILSYNKEMNKVLKVLTQVGMTIRGLYGEGSEALGDFYQISNQVTLGLNEDEIINNLTAVVNQIINQENMAREQLYSKYKYELEDRIYRSLGLLKSAVLLSTKECLAEMSNVRLGLELNIINGIEIKTLNSLLVDIQPASLQIRLGGKLSDRDRDIQRANLVKQSLK